MSESEPNPQEELRRVMMALSESVAQASDEEILADVRALGHTPEGYAEGVRRVLLDAVALYASPGGLVDEVVAVPPRFPEPEICEQLYKVYSKQLFGFLLRMAHYNSSAAEDLLQEVFLKAFQKLNTVREKEKVRPWLYRIAFNLAIEAERKAARSKEFSVGDLAPFDTHGMNDTPELKHDLERVISELPSQGRAVLVMHDISGFTDKEIGEMMHIKPSTVRAHLAWARGRIRAALGS